MTITPHRPGGPNARLGAATPCGYCGAQVRHRHGVPFETAEGGPWRLDDDGRFHRPGRGRGTHQVHRCEQTPTPASSAPAQMTLEVASWQ